MLPGYAASGCVAWACAAGELLSVICSRDMLPVMCIPGERRLPAIMAVILAGVLFAVSDFVWIF